MSSHDHILTVASLDLPWKNKSTRELILQSLNDIFSEPSGQKIRMCGVPSSTKYLHPNVKSAEDKSATKLPQLHGPVGE